jgi:hypothetical protein
MKTCQPTKGGAATKRRVAPSALALLAALGSAALAAGPEEKQTDRPAIVFLVAGQSNAGGMGVLSPEQYGQTRPPLVPGSTASEVGLSIDPADYTHSYIWVPKVGFERVNPVTNLNPNNPAIVRHGIELPVAGGLEKRFPDNDIYIIKWGPGSRSLHDHWNPKKPEGEYATFTDFYRRGMAQLTKEYPEVRVVGLYWDQGEADGVDNQAETYEENLTNFLATFRKDSGIPQLPVYLRKHVFEWPNIDTIIAAQEAVAAKDPHTHLLDINLDTRDENYAAWSFSPKNRHLSSKAFAELAKRLFDGPLKNSTIESFANYEPR